MNMFRNIVDSTTKFWSEATPVSRVGLIFLFLFSVAAIGLVGYWSSAPSYVTLVSEGDLDKISRVVDELEKKGIAYELGGAGGVLRVDQRSLARARVIADSVGVETEQAGSAPGMGSMWLDPAERKTMEVRRKERMLEATIASYEIIENADVHLNVPIKGPFQRTAATPSASVLVSLRPGQKLSSENVLAIASTVSFAIENLDPEMIRITDESGNVYRAPDAESGRVDNQMEYTSQQERKLATKAQQQLEKFFGFGNSSVQISLNYTFVESNEQSTKYDPDGKVAETEDINSKTTKRDQDLAVGVAGTSSNLAGAPGSRGGASSDIVEKTEELKNSFLVPKTVKSQTNNTPVRNYMTVSVLVNDQAPGVLQDDGTLQADIQGRVEQLVKTAVGFQGETDQITVDFAAFPTLEDLPEEAEPFDWMFVNDILKNVSLAVAALVVLILGMLTLRHFKAKPAPTNLVTESSAQRLSNISELARNNPEVFASVVKAWAGASRDETSTDEESNRAA